MCDFGLIGGQDGRFWVLCMMRYSVRKLSMVFRILEIDEASNLRSGIFLFDDLGFESEFLLARMLAFSGG